MYYKVGEVHEGSASVDFLVVDQDRGVKAGPEPLRTLAGSGKAFFGQNLVHRGKGVLRVGAQIEVLAYR